MLINAYMKQFVQLPVIKSNNDAFRLRKLCDQVESSVRNLKSSQMDTSGYGALLVPLLIEKPPFNLRQTQPTFQRWVNVVSTLWINVEITLIRL